MEWRWSTQSSFCAVFCVGNESTRWTRCCARLSTVVVESSEWKVVCLFSACFVETLSTTVTHQRAAIRLCAHDALVPESTREVGVNHPRWDDEIRFLSSSMASSTSTSSRSREISREECTFCDYDLFPSFFHPRHVTLSSEGGLLPCSFDWRKRSIVSFSFFFLPFGWICQLIPENFFRRRKFVQERSMEKTIRGFTMVECRFRVSCRRILILKDFQMMNPWIRK